MRPTSIFFNICCNFGRLCHIKVIRFFLRKIWVIIHNQLKTCKKYNLVGLLKTSVHFSYISKPYWPPKPIVQCDDNYCLESYHQYEYDDRNVDICFLSHVTMMMMTTMMMMVRNRMIMIMRRKPSNLQVELWQVGRTPLAQLKNEKIKERFWRENKLFWDKL